MFKGGDREGFTKKKEGIEEEKNKNKMDAFLITKENQLINNKYSI